MEGKSDHRSKLSYKPVVFRRGLALVLIPGILGSVFLLILNHLWILSGEVSLDEQRRSEVSMQLSVCFGELISYTYDIMTCSFNEAPAAKARMPLDRERFLATLKQVQNLCQQKEGQKDRELERVKAVADMAMDLANDAEELAPGIAEGSFTSNVNRFVSYSKLMRKGLIFADRMEEIIGNEFKSLAASRNSSEAGRKQLKSVVFLGLLGSILAVFWTVFAFSNGIIARLKGLAQDAAYLPQLSAPSADVGTYDEFSYLDLVFRKSAQELRDAAEQRRSIMQMLAHDMRSPIMATQVFIDILEDVMSSALSSLAAARCKTVKGGLKRVHDFVTELLTAEKLDSEDIRLDVSEFSLQEAVEECTSALTSLAEQKVIIIANNCQDTIICADRTKIIQVVMNYLSNAIKFSPKESTIVVADEALESSIKLSVRDNGPGVSKESQDCIFERFQQADSASKAVGFGLGLWICKLLIEAHDGRVGLNSEEGKGSEFWFTVPFDQEKKRQKEPISGNLAARSKREERLSFSKLVNSKIFQNCVKLALAILLLQCAWLFWLDSQLESSERLAARARTQSELLINVNYLWLNVFRANTFTAFYLSTSGKTASSKASENLSAAQQNVGVLNRLFQENRQLNPMWLEARSFVSFEMKTLEEMLLKKGENQPAADLGWMGAAMARTEDVNMRMHRLLEEELYQLTKIRSEQDHFRKQVQWVIIFGIVANLSMAIFLLWLFVNNITNRLNVLVDIASKLPERLVITEEIEGNDEIYQIYWLLCRASLNLADAYEHRRSIMSMVAHDIRSPLMAVQASLSVLGRVLQDVPVEMAHSSLSSANDNVTRVLSLVGDLLDLDKIEEGKMELNKSDCSLSELVDASVNSTFSLAREKQIAIKKSCSDVVFSVDRERIIQVLVNLLSNAIKFSPGESVVEISADLHNEQIEIRVIDEGPGIASEELERIFDKFFQSATQKEQGFGLGLAICKLIVQSHDGKISALSEGGKGSTFVILLPG